MDGRRWFQKEGLRRVARHEAKAGASIAHDAALDVLAAGAIEDLTLSLAARGPSGNRDKEPPRPAEPSKQTGGT
jgi:hypothetical protein